VEKEGQPKIPEETLKIDTSGGKDRELKEHKK
jgi:hypothetical protein